MKPKIVIAAPLRTAIGKFGRNGVFRNIPSHILLSECFKQVLVRSGLDASLIDEVIGGTAFTDCDAPTAGRVAALRAGIPEQVTAYGVIQNCATGLRAVTCAAQAIKAQDGKIYLVGAAESMSHWPILDPNARWGHEMGDGVIVDTLLRGLTDPIYNEHMGVTAQRVAKKHGTGRKQQDAFAVNSHRKALRAQNQGKFEGQIIPIKVHERVGMGQARDVVVTRDQGIRPETSEGALAQAPIPKFFVQEEAGGMITAGNSSQVSDAAAAMLVLTAGAARKYGITPMAEIIDYAYVGLDPRYMGEGPIPAIKKLLLRVGMRIEDIDFFEINEAFAGQCIPCYEALGIPEEKVNVHGGAIALGHPIGATGAILVVKAAYILKEFDKDYAIVSMCVSGGQGGAMLIKNYRGSRRRKR